MIIVAIMGWSYSAYEYNFYYDQAHLLERLTLILLCVGSWFSPMFVGPMAVVTYALSTQMIYPEVIAYSYTDKLVLFQFLFLFAVYSYIQPLTQTKPAVFIFSALCLVGTFYYYPAVAKMAIDTETLSWIRDNHLHNLFLSSYINGWLSFLPMETALQITETMRHFDVPLQAYTVIIEFLGAFLILFRRRGAMLILFGAILLHTGIFLSSGVCFWKWVTLDAVLIWYLWRSGQDQTTQDIFKPIYGLFCIAIIVPFNLFGGIRLGWWDSPINQFYDFEVVDTEGNTFEFSRYYMQPYDLRLTQSRLHFLVDNITLVNTYGTLHVTPAYELLLRGGDSALGEARAMGKNSYNYSAVQTMKNFILEFFTAHNQHANDTFLPSIIRPPAHILTIPRSNAYDGMNPIKTVRIWYTDTYYDDEKVNILRKEIVLEVDIPPTPFINYMEILDKTTPYILGLTEGDFDDQYIQQQFQIDGAFISTELETNELIEAVTDKLNQTIEILVMYQPEQSTEKLEIALNTITDSYTLCDTLTETPTLTVQRYIDSALSCDYTQQPIVYDNGITVLDKYAEYDRSNNQVRILTYWEITDDPLRDDYSMSLQIISSDWENMEQYDQFLYADVEGWYRVDLPTDDLPTGDYRIMLVVYQSDTHEELTGTDRTTGETGKLLPITVFTVSDT